MGESNITSQTPLAIQDMPYITISTAIQAGLLQHTEATIARYLAKNPIPSAYHQPGCRTVWLLKQPESIDYINKHFTNKRGRPKKNSAPTSKGKNEETLK